MSKDNELQAFPKALAQSNGMTLRDYFAGKAMQSLTDVYWDAVDGYESGEALIKCQAETAYQMADAMLEARNK